MGSRFAQPAERSRQRPLRSGPDWDMRFCMFSLPRVQTAVNFAFCFVPAAPASAAIVTYSNVAEFVSAVGPVQFESFENVAPLPFAVHQATVIGPITVSSDGRFGIVPSGPSQGQHATDGIQYLAYVARNLRLTFAQPITALSLDFIDFGDLDLLYGQVLTMNTSAGDSVFIAKTIADFDPPNGNEFFFGFTSSVPLTEITFHTTVADTIAIDAVRIASVPEPSAMLMQVCGAAWLVSRRRGLRIRNAAPAPVPCAKL